MFQQFFPVLSKAFVRNGHIEILAKSFKAPQIRSLIDISASFVPNSQRPNLTPLYQKNANIGPTRILKSICS